MAQEFYLITTRKELSKSLKECRDLISAHALIAGVSEEYQPYQLSAARLFLHIPVSEWSNQVSLYLEEALLDPDDLKTTIHFLLRTLYVIENCVVCTAPETHLHEGDPYT